MYAKTRLIRHIVWGFPVVLITGCGCNCEPNQDIVTPITTQGGQSFGALSQTTLDVFTAKGHANGAAFANFDVEVFDALAADCQTVLAGNGQYRKGRRFRDWTRLSDLGNQPLRMAHIAPIEGSHQNTEADLDWPGKLVAVFKLTDNHDTADDVYKREGRGCYWIWMDGTTHRGMAISAATGVKGVWVRLRYHAQTDMVTEGAKWHLEHDPGDGDFASDTKNAQLPEPNHGSAHACFSCMSTGWCEAEGPA